jgi:CRISPR-associated protein Csm5
MVDSFLKPYRLVVQTLSPVHIGSGVKLGKADFILRNGQVHVIDENKLLAWILDQPNAEQLALVLADDLRNPNGGVRKFLNERFRGNLDSIVAYRLSYQGNPKDISVFNKNPESEAYIPGSSIKGVLRSGLLRGKMLGNAGLRDKAAKAIKNGANRLPLRTHSDEIQANLFSSGTDRKSRWPNFDINRLLLARDSRVYDPDALEIVPVKTMSVQLRGNLVAKPFDIYVEAVKTGKKTRHSIIWQENLLSSNASELGLKNMEELMVFLPEYCRQVSQNLLTQEKRFYERHGRPDLAGWFADRLALLEESDPGVFVLPMGWGSGYDAKTITDLLDRETFEEVVDSFKNTWGLGKPGRRKEAQWMGPDDSPKSRKIIERPGKDPEPMGWVACRFVAEGETDWLAERREVLKELRPVAAITAPTVTPSIPVVAVESPKPANAVSAPGQSPKPMAAPAPKPLITKFTTTPQRGERFEGVVFGDEKGEIMLEIPGLDPDSQAYAVLFRKENPLIGKVKDGQKLICEVVTVKPEKNYWRVECRLG